MLESPPSSAETGNRVTFKVKPSPTGPMTLKQRVQLSEHCLRVRERVSAGDGFIPLGSTEQMRREFDDEVALSDLVEEAHPEIKDLNAQHSQLLHDIHKAPAGADVTALQEACAKLALEIIQIENSVGTRA